MPEALEIKVQLTAAEAERSLERLQASLAGVTAAAAKTDAAMAATGTAVASMAAGTSASASAVASLTGYLAELGGVSGAAASGVDALVAAAVASTGGLGQLGAVTAGTVGGIGELGAASILAGGGLGRLGATAGIAAAEMGSTAGAATILAGGLGTVAVAAGAAAGSLGSLGAASVVASGGLGKLGATVATAEAGTAATAASVGLLGGAVGKLVAVAAGYLSIQRLFSAIGEADRVYDLAAAFDMSAERLMVFTQAARQFGAEQGDLLMAFRGLSQSIQDALADPESTAADRFQDIKVAAEDLARVPLDEALLRVADGLSGIDNTATRTAVALDILHVRNANMLAFFRGGRKPIEDVTDEIQRLGTVSDENAAAADRFGDAVNRLKGAATASLSGFAPLMADIAESIESAVLAFNTWADLVGKFKVPGWMKEVASFFEDIAKWSGEMAGTGLAEWFGMADLERQAASLKKLNDELRVSQSTLQSRLQALPEDRAQALARQAGRTFEGGVLSQPSIPLADPKEAATQSFLAREQREMLADLLDAEEKRKTAVDVTTGALGGQVEALSDQARVLREIQALTTGIEVPNLPPLKMTFDIDTEPLELDAAIAGEKAAAAMREGFLRQWDLDRLNLFEGVGPADIGLGLPQGMPAISRVTGEPIKDDDEEKAKKAWKQVDLLAESLDSLGSIASATRSRIDDLVIAMLDFLNSLPKLLAGLSGAVGGVGAPIGAAVSVGGAVESIGDAGKSLERMAASTQKATRELEKLPAQASSLGKGTTVFGEPIQQGASTLGKIGGAFGQVAKMVGGIASAFLPIVSIFAGLGNASRQRQAEKRLAFFNEFERQLSQGGPLLEAASSGGLTWRTSGGGQTMTLPANATAEDIRRFGDTERLSIHINAIDSRSVADFLQSERTRDVFTRGAAFTGRRGF